MSFPTDALRCCFRCETPADDRFRFSTPEEHEHGLALFLERQHRPRFLAALDDPNLRRKLQDKLYHFKWLDPGYAEVVPTADAAALARGLRAQGAGTTCVLVASDTLSTGARCRLRKPSERSWEAMTEH
jgi:hypothetical protein